MEVSTPPLPQFVQINETVRMSLANTKYAEAMALVQAELGSATENAKNPHFNSSYADLESIINTAKPVLAKHGFSVQQCPCGVPPVAKVTTIIRHKSGEWLAFDLSLRPAKDDPQGHGGAITYARRYALESCLNMATKDDDGNAASGLSNQTSTTRSFSPNPPAPQSRPAQAITPAEAKDAYPIDHMITFGKFKGMNVNQVARGELTKYLNWIIDQTRVSGKPLSPQAQEIMDKIDSVSNARQPQDGPPPGMFDDIPF